MSAPRLSADLLNFADESEGDVVEVGRLLKRPACHRSAAAEMAGGRQGRSHPQRSPDPVWQARSNPGATIAAQRWNPHRTWQLASLSPPSRRLVLSHQRGTLASLDAMDAHLAHRPGNHRCAFRCGRRSPPSGAHFIAVARSSCITKPGTRRCRTASITRPPRRRSRQRTPRHACGTPAASHGRDVIQSHATSFSR